MKNHIIFKFIAILLCAASLLGALGGVLGVAALSASGLYDQSAKEMVSAQVKQDSAELADWLARNYASTELGGAEEALVNSQYGRHWFTANYDPDHYGYTITDAEGNELQSYHPELRDREDLYAKESFSITGKYIHVISAQPEDELLQQQRLDREALLGEDVVLDDLTAIPAEGAVVEQAIFVGANSQPILEIWNNGGNLVINRYENEQPHTFLLDQEALGFLFYSPKGNLVFKSFFDYMEHFGSMMETEVFEAYFTIPQGQIRLHQDQKVGRLYLSDDGQLVFLSESLIPAALPEETIPETTEETIPETVPETIPETLPPETLPEETEAYVETEAPVEEAEASSASALPEETEYAEEWEYTEEEAYTEETDYSEETVYTEETLPEETLPPETLPPETIPEEPLEEVPLKEAAEPVLINGKPLNEYQINSITYDDPQTGAAIHAQFVYVPLPELTVEVYMTENALRYGNVYQALEILRTYRSYLLPLAGVCLLLFAVFGVYLCTAAGRKPRQEEVRAGGLNRLPLDLYLMGGSFLAACILVYGWELTQKMWQQDFWTGCGILMAAGAFTCLLLVGFCFAFVAQLKTPDGFWWRNTLMGHIIRLTFRFVRWITGFLSLKGLPCCGAFLGSLWLLTMQGFVWLYRVTEKAMTRMGRALRILGQGLWQLLHRFLKLLPVTWQWLLAGIAILLFTTLAFHTHNDFLTLVFLLIPILIILYIAHCYGTLADSTRRMSKGNLHTKIDDQFMVGCFKDSAADLNALADVAVVAAQNQLKSERMKTELITNVSHDIKTPLTSIINYVDLLQKPHTEAEGQEYLEVLDRQSQRLKKLIEDLMDMSKANTGNMQVEITTVDAVEAVTQALGEFSDKLDRAGLTPVFRYPDQQLQMQADGRLVWRVLSNLLGNAVKYAMPGTRLYVDLMELEGQTVISLKNISREELAFTADELMARFVRGDASRNTEGSGLGLNIARSLMELQGGQLQLLLDGDLFKVTLIFPGTKE